MALRPAHSHGVIDLLRQAASRLGWPASLLTDNGRVYTTWSGGGAADPLLSL